jgi:hypothetical protein
MSSQKKEADAPSTQLERKRIDEFAVKYANNVYVASSAWDVQLLCGQLDQGVILDHTAVTIPWAQAKILHYILEMQLIGHEAEMGRIQLFPGAIKTVHPQVPQFAKDGYPNPEETWGRIRKLYEDFAAANPEVVRKKQSDQS